MIVALFKTNKHFKTSQKLFVGLTICDILCLICYFVTRVLMRYLSRSNGVVLFFMLTGTYSQFFAVQVFLLITILRCCSIINPFHQIKTTWIIKTLVVSALVSCWYPIVYLLVFHYKLIRPVSRFFELAAACFLLLFILPIIVVNVISFVYLRYYGNSSSSTETGNSSTPVPRNEAEEKSRQKKLKSVNTLLLITFSYVVCCLPQTFRMIVFGSNIIILPWLYLASTSMNSAIYIVRTSKIRQFYGGCCSTCSIVKNRPR